MKKKTKFLSSFDETYQERFNNGVLNKAVKPHKRINNNQNQIVYRTL